MFFVSELSGILKRKVKIMSYLNRAIIAAGITTMGLLSPTTSYAKDLPKIIKPISTVGTWKEIEGEWKYISKREATPVNQMLTSFDKEMTRQEKFDIQRLPFIIEEQR